MINKTTFGSFIREKRTEKGLTQKQLAEILFVSESAVSKWELGKSYPDITMIPDLCGALDVSEHELIGGATDTEYRRMKKDALLYRKITETFFRGFTGAYILSFIICLICDLAVNHRLTFSVITFGGLLTAFTFIPTCTRFTEKHKLAVFAGSTYLSIALLMLLCCISAGGTWFPAAASGTLLGYAVVFGPFLLKRYLPEKAVKFRPALYFTVCLLLTLTVLCTVNGGSAGIRTAVYIALYAFIPFAVISAARFLPVGRFFRAAVDTAAGGLVLYGARYVVSALLGSDASADYAVDFSDWQRCVNGNVYLLILIVSCAAAVYLTVMGIMKKRKMK